MQNITRKSSCRKPKEVYRPRHNLSKDNLSHGVLQSWPGGTPVLVRNTQSWQGYLSLGQRGTPVPGTWDQSLGYPSEKGTGTSHWGTPQGDPWDQSLGYPRRDLRPVTGVSQWLEVVWDGDRVSSPPPRTDTHL